MKKINLPQITNFLLDLLPKAGEILDHYYRLDSLKHKKKGKLDFVTEADLAADEFLRNNLRNAYPNIPILSEETSHGNFEKYKKTELFWIIDPIDGTTNFERKIPHFGISCALVSNSQSLLGVVYIPVSKNIYWAAANGEGAFCNDKRIFVSKIKKIEEAVVCPDWSHNLAKNRLTADFVRKLTNKVRSIKIMGSAVADLIDLSSGKVEIYYCPYVMPWDTAAASLIAQKAGVKVTDSNGGSWNVFTPGILAANPLLHKKIISLLKTK